MQPQISTNSLQYTGVNAPNPPTVIIAARGPETTDLGYPIGTIWIVKAVNSAWILTDVQLGTATWTGIGGGSSDLNQLETTNGTIVTPVAGTIQIDRAADPGATYTQTSEIGTYYTTLRERVTMTNSQAGQSCSLTLDNTSISGDASTFISLISQSGTGDNYIEFLANGAIEWTIGIPSSISSTSFTIAQNGLESNPFFVCDYAVNANLTYKNFWLANAVTLVAPLDSDPFAGTATLVSGTVTVTNSLCAASSLIYVSRLNSHSSTAVGLLQVTPGSGSFVINSATTTNTLETNDNSTVAYLIVNTHA